MKVTSGRTIYLLIPGKKKEYTLKNVFPVSDLTSVAFPKNNRCLFKLGFDNKQ